MALDFLSKNEQNALYLQEMYHRFGFSKYKMNKFEEYGFYMENQTFLADSRILTFSDPHGKLLALKPDVTTSIVKNCRGNKEKNNKIYYNESVYRIPKGEDEFKEIHQLGVEYIGILDEYQTLEILNLAGKSLERIHENYKLCFSNTALIIILMNQLGLKSKHKCNILGFLRQKNIHDLDRYLEENSVDARGIFHDLLTLPGDFAEGIPALEAVFSSWEYEKELKSFVNTLKQLENIIDSKHMYLDFSHIPSTEYYNGLVFSGYLDGLAIPALTGGRYDNLVEKMGLLEHSALGFAVDLSATHKFSTKAETNLETRKYTSAENPVDLLKEANKCYQEGKTFCFTT